MSRIFPAYPYIVLLSALAAAGTIEAQVSSTAYRALGQPDLRQNALNEAQGVELYGPGGIALDTRGGQTHIYIADTQNSRILAWADTASYQIGAAPALILGQPGPQYTNPLGIGAKGLTGPSGLAVDPTTGNLYVADTNDNRVVRFPAPFSNPTRVEPDTVYGQPGFSTFTAAAPSASSLNQPDAVAVDSTGNLWVADSNNNRVLRFNATTLNNVTPPAADMVIGQASFVSGVANAGGLSAAAFSTPTGLAFDAQNNLFVADYNNTRILKFAAPLSPSTPNPSASAVWGQSNFTTRGIPPQATASSLQGPTSVAVDASGNVYVAVPLDNRVLVFPSSGGAAKSVYGQTDFVTTTPNTGSYPLASASSLFAPQSIAIDAGGNVLIADTSNNRVLEFPAGAKAATLVWGQTDFVSDGPNEIKPVSVAIGYSMAIDYSSSPYALYVSDYRNNRVLVWTDSAHFATGDPANLVIGQPNLRTGAPNVDTQGSTTIPSATGLWQPAGLAVTGNGTLYVADSGNNRVLRFPRSAINQSGRITPDAVIGQSNFGSSTSALVSASSLKNPGGLAIGPNGDLFVADDGNNRVLEFPAGAGNAAVALRVYGQPSMNSSLRSPQLSAQTMAGPQGLAVDQGSNLYVVDTGDNRVLIFPNTESAPIAGMAATFVIGPASFASSAGTLKQPIDVATDSSGNIYVSDELNNRVLIYPSLVFLPVAGGTATGVVGQQTTSGTKPNWDSPDGLGTADSLNSPLGVYIDRQDTLYVGDAGNSRVLQFLKPAAVVNAATFQANIAVAPGSLASLFGNGFASGTTTISAATWPTVTLDRQVVINDQLAAPLYYFSSTQVNFQVPSNAPLGTERIAVRLADTGELVAGGTLQVQAAAPGIFAQNQAGTGPGSVRNQDGSLNTASNPAPAGSVVSIYGTGQGQVSPAVPDGTGAPISTLSSTVAVPTTNSQTCDTSANSMCVAFGSQFAIVQFSGLAPGFIGLWQINVYVPTGLGTGAVTADVFIDGSPSNRVTIAVK
jgi:uncharacterized protein (TIGR03437 family)